VTEVDDVKLISQTHTTPATGLSFAVRERAFLAPNPAAQGTALSCAGSAATDVAAAAQVAVVGVRSTDLPGSPSRGAPV
jgi:hypothetical protein